MMAHSHRGVLAVSLVSLMTLGAVRESSASAEKGLRAGLLSEISGHAAGVKCGWHRHKATRGVPGSGTSYGDGGARLTIKQQYNNELQEFLPKLIDVEYWAGDWNR